MIDRGAGGRRAPSLMRALSLVTLAAVLYATMHPWTDWRLRQPEPLAFLWSGLPRYWTGFDVATNLVAYLLLALVLTLGWLAPLRTRWAVPLATILLSLLSLGLETMQNWLPSRVPSILDWMANSAGAMIGATIGAALNAGARRRRRAGSMRSALPEPRERWRWSSQGSPVGWLLLLLWLSAQLVPQRLLFATGVLQPVFDSAARLLGFDLEFSQLAARIAPPAAYGVLIEAAAVICAVAAIGLLALELLRDPIERLVLLLLVALVALTLRSVAAGMVYGSGVSLAWLTPGAQGGLVIGVLALHALATLEPRGRAGAAMAMLAAGLVLANLAPADRYYETMSAGVGAGRLVSLHALLRLVSIGWPFAAIVYFWSRTRR